MAKINIIKPTGSEAYSLLSAFKADNETYIIFDSEKMGSMGLPIIYISKYTDKLEKITNDNEWQSVKNYLKGIISGTNFEYISIANSLNANEAFYTPLTLPQASFDIIKNRYVVTEDTTSESAQVLTPAAKETIEPIDLGVINTPTINETPVPSVSPAAPIEPPKVVENSIPVAPVMPTAPAASNVVSTITPSTPEIVTPINNREEISNTNVVSNRETITNTSSDASMFLQDKETFLKACENMFDALVSKYQRELSKLEDREKELLKKEQEIELKLKNANEHLANAEAREQVANIAHDNAQKIMDISGLMPNNPNETQTGVI